MFFKKKKATAPTVAKTLRANFTRGENGDFAEKFSSFAVVRDGELRSEKAFLPIGIDGCYGAANFGFGLIFCKNNQLSAIKNGEILTASVTMRSPCFLYDGASDTLLVSSNVTNVTYALTTAWAKVSDVGFNSMALYRERAFGVKNNILYFTDGADLTNFHGQITFPCSLYGVATVGDNLYVVGDNLYKISFDDDLENTEITLVLSGLEQSFPKSVCAVGDALFFATANGLFRWNGKLQKCNIYREIDASSQVLSPQAAVFRGNYFLLFKDKNASDTLAEVDGKTAEVLCFYPVSSDFLCGGKALYFDADGTLCALEGSGFGALEWKSDFCDFGTSFPKHFRKLRVLAPKSVTVKIVTDAETRIFDVPASEDVQTFNLRGTFRKVALELSSAAETRVSMLELDVEIRKSV